MKMNPRIKTFLWTGDLQDKADQVAQDLAAQDAPDIGFAGLQFYRTNIPD